MNDNNQKLDALLKEVLDLSNGHKKDKTEENELGISFRCFKSKEHIGSLILRDLIEKRNGEYLHKNGNTYRGFYLNDRNKEVGLMSQLYGGAGIFSLINRFDVKNYDNTVVSAIKSALINVLEYVEGGVKSIITI